MYSAVKDGNWYEVSIASFWKIMSFSVGSINFIAEKIFVCTFRTFRLLLPLEGRSWSVTGVVIISLIITVAVAISIVCCIIVLFASGVNAGSFGVICSISGIFSSFFFPSNVVTFSVDGGILLEMSKVVVFFLNVFFFTTSLSIFLLESGVGRVVRRWKSLS